ncbi:MAG: hypothetical protein ACXU8O_04120 [Asticcacaulis sp.]
MNDQDVLIAKLSRGFVSNSGRMTRLAALALGAYLLSIHALYYRNPGFVWSMAAGLPQPVRACLDPNFWFQMLTMAGYVAALWFAGALFDTLNDKLPFQEKAITALKSIGLSLLVGALAAMIKFDLMLNDVRHMAGFTAGLSLNDHDVPIAVIGAAFFMVAYQARRIRTRLDQFV